MYPLKFLGENYNGRGLGYSILYMDKSLFQNDCPGRLVPITAKGGKDWAFIPDSLPPQWAFPQDLWPLLAEARESLGTLHGITRTLHNPGILLRPLQRQEAVRSSSLEGTFATPKEIILFELDPRYPTSKHDPVNTWREVYNYDQALQAGVALLEKIPLSLRLIRALHKVLLSGVRGHENDPGSFRRCQVQIGHDRRFIPPPVDHLDGCLNTFENYMNVKHSFDPLVECYLMHYQFEAIHPFRDGNGRVGRLLLSLMTAHYTKFAMAPWLFMSAYFDSHKDEYIDRLFRVSSHSDWSGWIEFCLRGTIEQASDTILRCDQLRKLREKYIANLNKLDKGGSFRILSIVDELFKRPVVTIVHLAKKYDVTYPTAQSDVNHLVDAGVLKVIPEISPKTFIAEDIIIIAHHEV